jgi:hypothetical protein
MEKPKMKKYCAHRIVLLTLIIFYTSSVPGVARPLFINIKKAVGTAAVDEAKQKSPGEVWGRTELYFGSNKPDGTVVTEQEFKQFLDTEITPRFPDGLTLLTGFGQFRNSQGVIVQERSMVLILLYPLQRSDANQKIEEIRSRYKEMFQQESVLRVDSLAKVSF